MDAEVFYDGVSQITGRLTGIEGSLDLLTDHKADIFSAAALLLPRLVSDIQSEEVAQPFDDLAVKRAVRLARMLYDQVYEPKQRPRAKEPGTGRQDGRGVETTEGGESVDLRDPAWGYGPEEEQS